MFFELCQELNAKTETERLKIMKAMIERGEVKSVTETNLSKEEYMKHLSEKFGNVMNISSKGEIL